MPQRFRDLLILEGEGRLVVACDSIGGIGPKPADHVSVDARTTAHFGVRVPLLEVLCSGARPVALANALCVELSPTGQQMIEEIRAVALDAGIAPDAVTGSTEENVPTVATGIGITVIGLLDSELPRARPGDAVVCLGLPVSAPHDSIHIGHPAQVGIAEVRRVLASGLVHDALPVGSKGVGHELAEMAATAGLSTKWVEDAGVDPARSGGPASCVLVACAADQVDAIVDLMDPGRPWAVVARLG